MKKGSVKVRLDRERTLYYGFNAMADFEKEYGTSWNAFIYDVFKRDENGKVQAKLVNGEEQAMLDFTRFGFHELRLLVWAGLRRESPGLTVHDAGQLIEDMPEETLSEKQSALLGPIITAISERIAKAEGDEKKGSTADQAQLTGTG